MVHPDSVSLPDTDSKPSQKKPRHRHSPAQLAALNELFDKDEHPSLELRCALAGRLGMETKTVNAWFQNKRASTKKRSKATQSADTPASNPMPSQYSPASYPPPRLDYDDYVDDDYPPLPPSDSYSRASSVLPPDISSFYYPHNAESPYYTTDSDAARRTRLRPSQDQTEELKKLYTINPHPSAEERQAIAERIGMRYHTVTNWFQNQRSLAKKRREDESDFPRPSEYSHDRRQYSAFPPSTQLPPTTPSMTIQPPSLSHQDLRRSPSLPPMMDDTSPRRTYSRRSTTPYGNMPISFSRPRRSRPEPYQLSALKELFRKTSTPTIEERSALALEIGMDVSKVTNWFRNLRQTARKKAKKTGSDDEYNHNSLSATVSRSGTPSLGSSSSSSSVHDETTDSHAIDDDYDMQPVISDIGSDDDYQEALTPSPDNSPSPIPGTNATATLPTVGNMHGHNIFPDSAYYAELEKVSATQYSGIKIEDALLLLSFHHHAVH